MVKKKSKKMIWFKWQYCECGCHASYFKFGEITFGCLLDVRTGNQHLYLGHVGGGNYLGRFRTDKQVEGRIKGYLGIK